MDSGRRNIVQVPIVDRDINHISTSVQVTIDEDQQFTKPIPQTLKSGNQRQKISRCAVCMRNPPPRMLPLTTVLAP